MTGSTRTLVAVGTGVVLVNIAMVGASAVGTLVAAGMVGESWSGAPNAAAVLGTALGALGLGSLMARRGRRAGLVAAYATGTIGAIAATLGVISGTLQLLMLGMVLLGIGNAAAQLSRYAVAELFAPAQRGLVLGAVVWGGTVGAIVGPNLLGPTAAVAEQTGWPPLAGAYVVALLAMAASAAAALLIPGRQV